MTTKKPPTPNINTVEEILKEFLDAVDYTLEAPIEQADDADFFDRPFIEAKEAIKQLQLSLLDTVNKRVIEHRLTVKDSEAAEKADWFEAVEVNQISNELNAIRKELEEEL